MKTKKGCTHVRSSPEDLGRIVRLEEEITGRVEEMVRILARVHGRSPALPVVAFRRREGCSTASGAEVSVATHEFVTDDGHTGCWDNVNRVCCEGPCPC